MAYTKQTWVDRVVQYARRYTKTDIDANTVELVPEPGTVTTEGTAITASRMNNAENEIEFLSNRHATTTNTGNAYTLTLTNSKYNLDIGATLTFIANATNTGGSTLNVNGLGAKTFKKEIEGSLIDLFYGDIAINRLYEAVYDGTYFILKRPSRRDEFYQASSVGTDAYAVSLSNEMIYNFSVYNGLTVRMKADVSNTGAATLAVNGAAAKTIKKASNTGLADVETGNIQAGCLYTLIYDGTYFQLQNPTSHACTGSFTGDGTSNRTINIGLTPKIVILHIESSTKRMTLTINSSYKGMNLGDGSDEVFNITGNTLGAEIVDGGFRISGGAGAINENGTTHYWFAI